MILHGEAKLLLWSCAPGAANYHSTRKRHGYTFYGPPCTDEKTEAHRDFTQHVCQSQDFTIMLLVCMPCFASPHEKYEMGGENCTCLLNSLASSLGYKYRFFSFPVAL